MGHHDFARLHSSQQPDCSSARYRINDRSVASARLITMVHEKIHRGAGSALLWSRGCFWIIFPILDGAVEMSLVLQK